MKKREPQIAQAKWGFRRLHFGNVKGVARVRGETTKLEVAGDLLIKGKKKKKKESQRGSFARRVS